jgi:hypothetical protein
MSNEPVGRVEPLVMIPRFTTYAGHNEGSTKLTSVPLDVSRFSKMTVTFWRGPLLGGGSVTFSAQFESSHDADKWFAEGSAITTASGTTKVEIDLDRRWLRVAVELTANLPGDVVAITCWAVGSLEHRTK